MEVDNLHVQREEPIEPSLEDSLAAIREEGENPVQEPQNNVPEKYRGKSIEQIIEMHQNAESTLGRQSNELGDLRKMNEQLMQAVSQPAPAQPTDVDDEVDWYGNPEAAVNKAIDRKLDKVEQALREQRAAEAARALTAKHPDADSIVADYAFQTFVSESPIRQQLMQNARQNMNADALEYLITEFKDKQKVTASAPDVQSAVGETGSAAASAPKNTILRSQIQHLQETDPRRYESLVPEIRRAYEEGRVVNDIT